MKKISVLLPVYNEEDTIRACLDTIKWADEILVVDSFSTDRTLEIAQEYGARIIQHEYINSAKQKNWAIPQCSHEWVLQIDADERVDDTLKQEILKILENPNPSILGYYNPTKNHAFGQWIKTMGIYPDNRLRFFMRDCGRFEDKEVDARVVVTGDTQLLKGHVHHFGLEAISPRLRSIDRYTRYESDEREKQGRNFSGANIFIKTIGTFIYYFIYKRGFLDGMRGAIVAFWKTDFIFWTYAKLWEKEVNQGKRK